MLADGSIHSTSGNISEGIEADGSIKAVIDFISINFARFAATNLDLHTLNEKGISQKLCIFLIRSAKGHPFFFHAEYMEDIIDGNSPQVDIGMILHDGSITISDREYSEDNSFFSIEAKRLPTPKNREKEYVIGNQSCSGGMERFKKGIHGSLLKYACIIGYVQEQNFDHWYLKINSWIDELAKDQNEQLWSETDKIHWKGNNKGSICVELFSKNSRESDGNYLDEINLYHFWIDLTPKAL